MGAGFSPVSLSNAPATQPGADDDHSIRNNRLPVELSSVQLLPLGEKSLSPESGCGVRGITVGVPRLGLSRQTNGATMQATAPQKSQRSWSSGPADAPPYPARVSPTRRLLHALSQGRAHGAMRGPSRPYALLALSSTLVACFNNRGE